jgi:DNA-binding PadR family transcriptional regulator
MDFPRLSAKEALILQMLVEKGEAYGLGMVHESKGDLKRGTIYVTLSRMEDKGFVESRREELPAGVPGAPRRIYRASGHGARVLSAWETAGAILSREVA